MTIYAFYERDVHHGSYTPISLIPSMTDHSATFYTSVEACRKAVNTFIAEWGKYYSDGLNTAEWHGNELVCKGGSMNGIPYGEIMPARLVEE